jgi:DNA-binding transcriptional ArsR family regulator
MRIRLGKWAYACSVHCVENKVWYRMEPLGRLLKRSPRAEVFARYPRLPTFLPTYYAGVLARSLEDITGDRIMRLLPTDGSRIKLQTMYELAQAYPLSKTTLGATIKRLVKAGKVERIRRGYYARSAAYVEHSDGDSGHRDELHVPDATKVETS